MRLLLLGGTGQIGREFRLLELPKDIEVVAPPRHELDLSDARAIAEAIAAGPWSVVVNAAGYTDVDRAESEQAAAFAVNAEALFRLAAETKRHGLPLIHLSTDYIFDGRKNAPYVETDQAAPLNVYGHSKLAGERAVGSVNPRHIILRTSWVYSPYGDNFVKTILRLSAERSRLTVVEDQRGCPTAARDIATACRDIALLCVAEPERVPYGIYHFSNEGETNRFEFAKTILEMASPRLTQAPQIVPIRTIDYPTPAVRPADTRLDCHTIIRKFDTRLRPWRESLRQTLAQLLPENGIL